MQKYNFHIDMKGNDIEDILSSLSVNKILNDNILLLSKFLKRVYCQFKVTNIIFLFNLSNKNAVNTFRWLSMLPPYTEKHPDLQKEHF